MPRIQKHRRQPHCLIKPVRRLAEIVEQQPGLVTGRAQIAIALPGDRCRSRVALPRLILIPENQRDLGKRRLRPVSIT